MNLALAILAIWFVESSCGQEQFMRRTHPWADCGHLGMKPSVVEQVNRIVGYKKYKLSDRFDKHTSFEMARIYLRAFLPSKYTLTDVGLLWRYGPTGRYTYHHERAYVNRLKCRYKQLLKGN